MSDPEFDEEIAQGHAPPSTRETLVLARTNHIGFGCLLRIITESIKICNKLLSISVLCESRRYCTTNDGHDVLNLKCFQVDWPYEEGRDACEPALSSLARFVGLSWTSSGMCSARSLAERFVPRSADSGAPTTASSASPTDRSIAEFIVLRFAGAGASGIPLETKDGSGRSLICFSDTQ